MALDPVKLEERIDRVAAGATFGRLSVLARLPSRNGKAMWKCQCVCGEEIPARADTLKNGNTKSCGCLVKEIMAEVGRSNGTHRLSRTAEYRSWARMIHRCYVSRDNKFQYYGARGVTVCERWKASFETFLADMGNKPSVKHTIDRINTNGNYEPGNCRWATYSQQNNNRRPFKRRA